MADVKYVRGKLAKKGKAKKSERMRHINSFKHRVDQSCEGDHTYNHQTECEDEVTLNLDDAGAHVTISSSGRVGVSKPWFEGRRVVELDVLAKAMSCVKCNSWLRLQDIEDEVVYGMASLLYIRCPSSICQFVNTVPTGKKSDNRSFDINSKAYLAMINAGMGPSHVTKFLAGCNIPPIDESTLRRKEKKLAPAIIGAAEASCERAQEEELIGNSPAKLEGSFDAGWQKRGSGWQYDSNTGHASLIGVKTGKVLDYDIRSKVCSICQFHTGRKETIPSHDCNINWTGSSKGMEPDMACCIIQKMEDKGHEIGTLHADNDTTTQSRLPSTIIKKNDKSHVKKNLASSLYSLSKKHKQLKSTGVIPYIVRCFMYTISKHQGCKETLGAELATVVPHIFGDHNQCSSSWCTYNKDPTKFRYKHLPDGKALSGDHLKEDLEKLAKSYIDRADRLMNLGSTQANESFNNSVASFAPKNRFYGGTKSLKARISSAVMLKNEGSGWLSKVNENILLSPGQMTKLHGLRRDKIRKRVRDMKHTVAFKRKRISLKNKNVRCDRREAVKEGDTYGKEIELQEDADIETIPSKIKLSGEETVVVFDLETTGLSRRSDITQLAAFDGEELFNSYIIPSHNISPTASSLTGLSFDFHTNQMYHHGTPVKSEDLYTAMLDFVDYLNKKQKPILFGHNIAAYDVPVLLKKLQETHLLPEFLKQIAGCIDTLKLSRRQFDKNVIGNYKQQNLVSKILGEDYDAHDASADVKSLYKLLGKLDFSEKDIFPFNVSVLTESLTPLIRASSITKPTARRLAQCGLCQRHLQLAFNRGGETGLNFVLKEHGFKARTAKAITRFFSSKEE